ncbi:MAG: hypothetical protein AAFX06_22720 [Planctomycetota bacterium]
MRLSLLYTAGIVAGICFAAQDTFAQDTLAQTSRPIPDLIENLGADSYTSRRQARHSLLQMAKQDATLAEQVRRLLRAAQEKTDDFESKLATRSLLADLREIEFDASINRFLYDPAFDADQMTGWESFAGCAGHDDHARRLFVSVLKRNPSFVVSLQDRDYVALTRFAEADLRRDDAVGWSMLLATACQTPTVLPSDVVFRVNAALRCDGAGPMVVAGPITENGIPSWRERVLQRMISRYLDHSAMDIRDKICIGIRYQCPRAEEWCHEVLANRNETASRTVTALLGLSKLSPHDERVDSLLSSYRGDYRTSHVWRSMAAEKTTRRTQVRDIAVALSLHRKGVDPRSVGFDMLQADPILMFRAYSLGFESGEAREASFLEALARLDGVSSAPPVE